MKDLAKEFKDFINKGNVVTIAVGLVMALYFKTIVDAMIDGIINPIVAAIFGESDFSQIGFDLGDSFISIGLVINAIITFIIVAFVLFLIVKLYNRMVAEKPEDAAPTEAELLTEIRDLLARRNG